jgi:putative Holliday junction resolvase
MRLLGIDLGDSRTGVASGDTASGLASPLLAVSVPASREADLASAIARLADEQEADALVVGLPLNMDGSEGPRARIVRRLAAALAEAAGRPVHLHDERLTSAEADWAMAGSGLTHKQKKARRDALAAAAILRDFLAHPPDPPDTVRPSRDRSGDPP